jgi:hypothetical protein
MFVLWGITSALPPARRKQEPGRLGRTPDELDRVIPDTRRVELDGLGHAAAWNVDLRRNPDGNPQAVAARLKEFLRGRRRRGPLRRDVRQDATTAGS